MKYKRNLFVFTQVTVFMVLSLGSSAQDKWTLPESQASQMAVAFLEAFNASDRQEMETFIAERRTTNALKRISVENRMKMFDQQKQVIGTFDSIYLMEHDSLSLELKAYSETTDSWFKIGFKLSEESGKLEGLLLRPGKAPKGNKEAAFGKWKTLRKLLQNAVKRKELTGISMVTIINGKIDQVSEAGVRDYLSREKIKRNDRFHLGSLTKSMTATLMGILIDKGHFTFASTIGEIFSEIDMLPAYRNLTIKQLLDHQGGIPGYLTVSDEEEEQLLSLPGNATEQRYGFLQQLLRQEPGSEMGAFAYSNAGYTILGAMAEKTTGQSWESLMNQYVFEPLDMNTAGFGWPDTENQNQPAGHFGPLASPKKQGDDYVLGAYLDPAGDLHASSEDVAKFLLMHLSGLNGRSPLMSEETLKTLHESNNGVYAGGWMIRSNENEEIIHEHWGGAGTFMAYMGINQQTQEGWVVMSNVGDFRLQTIFKDIMEAWDKGR